MSIQTALPTTEALSVNTLEAHPDLIRVGMGVTLRTGPGGLYVPFTVIAVNRGGRELVIQQDTVTRTGPRTWEDNGEKTYTANLNGRIEIITKRKDGSYIAKGAPMQWYSTRYTVGYRREWTDFSQ